MSAEESENKQPLWRQVPISFLASLVGLGIGRIFTPTLAWNTLAIALVAFLACFLERQKVAAWCRIVVTTLFPAAFYSLQQNLARLQRAPAKLFQWRPVWTPSIRGIVSLTTTAGITVACAAAAGIDLWNEDEKQSPTTALAPPQSPATIKVPDIAGIPAVAAHTLLTNAGLNVTAVGELSPTSVALDTVPAAGAVVRKGTTVTLHVSSPSPPAPPALPASDVMPNLTGLHATAALDEFEGINAGETLFNRGQTSPRRGIRGVVIHTTPPAGALIPRGSLITLVFSHGEQLSFQSVS